MNINRKHGLDLSPIHLFRPSDAPVFRDEGIEQLDTPVSFIYSARITIKTENLLMETKR